MKLLTYLSYCYCALHVTVVKFLAIYNLQKNRKPFKKGIFVDNVDLYYKCKISVLKRGIISTECKTQSPENFSSN